MRASVNTNRWTAGPWALNYACSAKGDDPTDLTMDVGEHERYVISVHAVLVADCYADTALDFGLPETFSETQANAHLIAAAPELYAALQELLDAMPSSSEDRRLNAAQREAERVLAKARGEEVPMHGASQIKPR